MKKYITLLLAIILIACNFNTSKEKEQVEITTANETEKFKELNSEEINQLLKLKEDDFSAKDVIKLYYPIEINEGEGNETIEISEKTLKNGNTLVTLIHDNLLDDSIKAKKYILELKNENNRWIVISIKNSWKCREGRGHTNWGIELCK
ncbi:hypothetical protein MHL31_04115 [Lutibacter sp. A80]|uniref:hypothetical protein n=1 Tax=Lutibacter sp. A80 TaxID=2918453 RepID=UPI001F053622|nr:hypothetical protein [Lutibacter sp. A80]UMB61394.1 hypothetical protein MHL31_04115 [Lutibacter sp. A80]